MYSAAKEKAGSKKSLRWNIRCHVWRKKYQNSFKASFPNKLCLKLWKKSEHCLKILCISDTYKFVKLYSTIYSIFE